MGQTTKDLTGSIPSQRFRATVNRIAAMPAGTTVKAGTTSYSSVQGPVTKQIAARFTTDEIDQIERLSRVARKEVEDWIGEVIRRELRAKNATGLGAVGLDSLFGGG